jgi:hypothetical protein
VRFEGKRQKSSGPVIQTAEDTAKKMKIPIQGMRVKFQDRYFPMKAQLGEILGGSDNVTFDIEKGTCLEFRVRSTEGEWYGCGDEKQTFEEILSRRNCTLDEEGELMREDGETAKMQHRIGSLVRPGRIEELQKDDWV